MAVTTKRKISAKVQQRTVQHLFSNISNLIAGAKQYVVRNVNNTLATTNFLIGKLIIEHEQQGEHRAKYSDETLKQLSKKLTKQFGKGYSVDNLENIRRFYLVYGKSETLSRKLKVSPKSETVSRKSENNIPSTIGQLFPLSWSHYVLLIKMNDDERKFYEIESVQQNWSVRELQRQFDVALYERLSLSKKKKKTKDLSKHGQIINDITDALKEPYILEFLGLKEEQSYSENELETAIIDKLENFMLELGKGFLFAGRQVRFTFDEEHFFVDLVFYNRLLKCFVLFDLKIGKLRHQDIGQMLMYTNYYDRHVKTPEENLSIGILLCKEKNQAIVEMTLPENNKRIFARKYQLYLPTKAQLIKQLK